MGKSISAIGQKTPEPSTETPSKMFVQLDGKSSTPSQFRAPGAFSIIRLQSPVGLSERITKRSPVPALLLSVSLKPLSRADYQLWAADKLLPTSAVRAFRSNVIDFESEPRCWAGCAFDYVHYSVPREGLEDIAEDVGFGPIRDYRLAVLEDDIVAAQITKSILPFLGRNDGPSMLALDQFSLVLGAHLLQRYGIIQKIAHVAKGGLAPWQKRRACEILHENMHGRIRLSKIAAECGLSVSHFARSFKISFGISAHQWLLQRRIEHAKELMKGTRMSLMEIAIHTGFHDQAEFTRVFQQLVRVSPGRWRRQQVAMQFHA
jgi:AraC family transcriptional regulator